MDFEILAIVMGSITVIVVALRFFSKLHYERRFRLDDYLVVFCFVSIQTWTTKHQLIARKVLNVANTVLCIYGRKYITTLSKT